MDCLALRLPGSVTDDTIRKLDEFRFTAYPAGTMAGYSQINFGIRAQSSDAPVRIRIVTGTGSLSGTQGGSESQELTFSNSGTSETKNTCYLKTSSECAIGIENCKSISRIGYYDTSESYFFNRLSSVDSPVMGMNISDLTLFKSCLSMLLNPTGQKTRYKGDISSLAGFSFTMLRMTGSSDEISEVTGDISGLLNKPTLSTLDLDYTSVYGSVSGSQLTYMGEFRCRGGKVSGNFNMLPNTVSTLMHSTSTFPSNSAWVFNFSAEKPKPRTLFLYDNIGNAFSGNMADVIDSSTSSVNISCTSKGSPVNVDVYEIFRKTYNRVIANLIANFGTASSYSFSGSISELALTGGLTTLNLSGTNVPAANAVEILNMINRSTIPTGVKTITLRTDATDTGVIAAVANVQAKGYTVNILPLQ